MHWYDKEGNPQHFIVGANGVERDSTLRDARKHNWFPSVTEILNVAAKPGLESWKQNQLLYAALTVPRPEGVSDDEFLKIVRQDAAQQALEARNRGDEIHKCIEALWKMEDTDWPEELIQIGLKAIEAIITHTGQDRFTAEATVVNTSAGYGGMIDLHNDDFVIDYKTKDITDKQWEAYQAGKDPRLAYPEMCMQLSAYNAALGLTERRDLNRRLINVFVDRTEPGRVIIHEWKENMYDRFECLLKYWQMSKNYRPEV